MVPPAFVTPWFTVTVNLSVLTKRRIKLLVRYRRLPSGLIPAASVSVPSYGRVFRNNTGHFMREGCFHTLAANGVVRNPG